MIPVQPTIIRVAAVSMSLIATPLAFTAQHGVSVNECGADMICCSQSAALCCPSGQACTNNSYDAGGGKCVE